MRKSKKEILVFSMLAFLSCTIPVSASAAGGWVMDDDGWRYLANNGETVTDKWISGVGMKYYIDYEGLMVSNDLLNINGKYYYFHEDGKMAASEWILIEDEEEHTAYWYYFGSSGQAYRRTESSFRKTINGKKYIFDDEGRLLTGWINADGQEADDENPFIEGVYYAGEDGTLYQNQWFDYTEGSKPDTASQLGEKEYAAYSNMWMYFDTNGKKVQSVDSQIKEQKINDVIYGFDENGVMLSGWGPATGSNAIKYYSEEAGGARLSNTWLYAVPSEAMDEEDHLDNELSWWYFTSNGKAVTDTIKTVDGKKYYFNATGKMQTGFVLSNDGTLTRFKANKWKSSDFMLNNNSQIKNSDIYFFNSSDKDGSMQTGNNISIKLDNGTYIFGFNSSGKAYGNHGQIEKHNGYYYINGIRLVADSDLKYGVIEAEGKYYVVDTNGKVQTGNKVLAGGNGANNDGWFIVINGQFKAFVGADERPRWYQETAGTGYYYYNSDDKKAGEFIAGADSAVDLDSLPEDGNVNFQIK